MTLSRISATLAALLMSALFLAGCMETASYESAPAAQCEEGVEGLSQLGDITPAGC